MHIDRTFPQYTSAHLVLMLMLMTHNSVPSPTRFNNNGPRSAHPQKKEGKGIISLVQTPFMHPLSEARYKGNAHKRLASHESSQIRDPFVKRRLLEKPSTKKV
jgi:hypothetical protein